MEYNALALYGVQRFSFVEYNALALCGVERFRNEALITAETLKPNLTGLVL